MPSVLVLHYAVAPSEPLAAALTISYNDSNLQGKSSATNQQNIYILKSRKHCTTQQDWKEGIWHGHLCNDSSFRGAGIPEARSEDETHSRVHQEAFTFLPSDLTGKVLAPTLHNTNMWGMAASSPAPLFCTLNFGNSLAHLYTFYPSLLVPYKCQTAQCAPHLHRASDLTGC